MAGKLRQPSDMEGFTAVPQPPQAPRPSISLNDSADPEYSSLAIAPIPPVLGTSTDASRQFYRRGVSQIRMFPLPAASALAQGAQIATHVQPVADVADAANTTATTANTTSPGLRYFSPSLRPISFACGGKMEDTRTRFCAAMPASRNASSKEVSRSLCFPTPLVKNSRRGTMLFPNSQPLRII